MISVCIATYNGEKFISKQLSSIIEQLDEADEIVISDDSSTDNTIKIIKSFEDSRIKLFPNQKFRSPIRNFEFALSKASGDFVFLSDQDDLWDPSKVALVMAEFDKNHCDMIVTDHSVIDDNDRIIYPSFFDEVSSRPGIIHNLKKNTYYGCCMAFKRKILTTALPFPKDISMHDIWLGFVADLFYRASFLKYPLTKYRRHSTNVSNASELKSNNSIFKKIRYRWHIIKYLPLLLLRKYKS